ncbi:hypothetical protein U27_05067 [Candidatus Vecturithrix granuli]|uniref:Glycoside hydrolase family 5 domain-containing protein n=1 Tax=Vecturithrix granuli TaxID=1499967 RepID=A0A081C0I9_VECG1|nr:hypothetical protein U27_05067 [Candidatus Vecturithrix granuli]
MSLFKKDGDQIKLRDSGQAVRLFIVEQFGFSHFPDGEILKYLDALAENGANGLRVFGFFPFGLGREQEPHVRSGSGFDLSRFNDTYYDYLRKWVEYAQKRGIVVLYELFDSVGVKYRQLENYHPFGQYFKQESEHNRRLDAFTKLGGQLEQLQKHYVSHTVNILRQYPNVIFGVMNEFKGNAKWHYEISKFVRSLAPQHLISGSDDSSPGTDDPNVDIWTIHTGSYDLSRCQSNVGSDVKAFRPKIGNKIMAYSTDGFGNSGMKCETPDAMRKLAQDISANRLQIFRFLDQKAYVSRDDKGNEYPAGSWTKNSQAYETAQVKRANTSTYRAIADVFKPTALPGSVPAQEIVESPKEEGTTVEDQSGILGLFRVAEMPHTHTAVFKDKGGKAIKATTREGFLAYGPYVEGLPNKPLDVYFSLQVDNNTADDRHILSVDIYDSLNQEIWAQKHITRREFPVAGEFVLFKLSFTPPTQSRLEFRIYYKGYSYVAADKIVVADPEKIKLNAPSDIPGSIPSTSPTIPVVKPETPESPQEATPATSDFCQGNEILCIPQFTSEIIKQLGGKSYGGDFSNGRFKPSNKGGIEFEKTIDVGRKFMIDFTIEGNIANVNGGEMDGGKVSLFDILHGKFNLSMQRMYRDYRGGGLFRVIITNNYGSTEGGGYLITGSKLAGNYTIYDWGDEPHRFRIIVQGSTCQLLIDDSYKSKTVSCSGSVSGAKPLKIMIGNRLDRISNQHAITWFKCFKIEYL